MPSEERRATRRLLPALLPVLLVTAIVSAQVLLSTTVEIEGPLAEGSVELAFPGGVVSLHNATPANFTFTLKNTQTVTENITLQFDWLISQATVGFEELDFSWSFYHPDLGTIPLPNGTWSCLPNCTLPAYSGALDVAIEPLEYTSFWLTITFTFVGKGSHSLRVAVLDRA